MSDYEVLAAAFGAAACGTAAQVPAYRVTPCDGGPFVVVPLDPQGLDAVGRNLIAGDCRRRFGLWVEGGADPFADIRLDRRPPEV